MIIKYLKIFDLVLRHKLLLDMLKWENEDKYIREFSKAVACPLNPGIPDLDGIIKAPIYVDDLLGYAVNKEHILRLLAATIEAIFAVCDQPNIEVRQCLLYIVKWEELVAGMVQTVMRLPVNTNRLIVGITLVY